MKTFKQFLEQQTHQQASLERLKKRREDANQEQEDLALSSKLTQAELAAEREEEFTQGVEERAKRQKEEAERRAEALRQRQEEEAERRAERKN